MITKQQLDDVYKEVELLEEQWLTDKKRKVFQSYPVSHKLLGYFLQAFDSIHPSVAKPEQAMKKLDDLEKPKQETKKAVRDPKTGRYLKRK